MEIRNLCLMYSFEERQHLSAELVFPWYVDLFLTSAGHNIFTTQISCLHSNKNSIPHSEVFPKCLFEGKWGHFASLTCSGLSALCSLWRGEWAAGENKHNIPNRPLFLRFSLCKLCSRSFLPMVIVAKVRVENGTLNPGICAFVLVRLVGVSARLSMKLVRLISHIKSQ